MLSDCIMQLLFFAYHYFCLMTKFYDFVTFCRLYVNQEAFIGGDSAFAKSKRTLSGTDNTF